MRRMGWSWPEYCALPASYLGPLLELLRQEDDEAREARRRSGR